MTIPDELERAVERLHELAKAASDGPWTYERCIRSGFEVWGRYAASIVSSDELARHGAISREDDAAFIAAANPATILSLLSERAELLAAVERMRGALEPFAALAEEFSVCGDGQPIGIKAASGKSDLNVGHLRRAAEAAK